VNSTYEFDINGLSGLRDANLILKLKAVFKSKWIDGDDDVAPTREIIELLKQSGLNTFFKVALKTANEGKTIAHDVEGISLGVAKLVRQVSEPITQKYMNDMCPFESVKRNLYAWPMGVLASGTHHEFYTGEMPYGEAEAGTDAGDNVTWKAKGVNISIPDPAPHLAIQSKTASTTENEINLILPLADCHDEFFRALPQVLAGKYTLILTRRSDSDMVDRIMNPLGKTNVATKDVTLATPVVTMERLWMEMPTYIPTQEKAAEMLAPNYLQHIPYVNRTYGAVTLKKSNTTYNHVINTPTRPKGILVAFRPADNVQPILTYDQFINPNVKKMYVTCGGETYYPGGATFEETFNPIGTTVNVNDARRQLVDAAQDYSNWQCVQGRGLDPNDPIVMRMYRDICEQFGDFNGCAITYEEFCSCKSFF
jgi:hypothetical protein